MYHYYDLLEVIPSLRVGKGIVEIGLILNDNFDADANIIEYTGNRNDAQRSIIVHGEMD